jgi:DNA polymerase III delta subunit
MLYIFHGSEIDTSREKAHSLLNSLRTKKPDAAFIRVEADQWNTEMVRSHLESQGLFSNKYIVFLDRVTEKAEARDGLLELLSEMKTSPNIFIVLEGVVKAELKKAFAANAEKVVESEKPASSKFEAKKEFNVFALADAVGSRDAYKSWSIYREAVDSGMEAEAIIGTLFWQVKSLKLVQGASSAAETGLNPFVFSKSKKYAGNFSKDEIDLLLNKLITIYHDAHRGVVDAELATERLMLGISGKVRG